MDLVTPGLGLIFWMLITFTILLVLLRKFAWKPILGMIKDREQNIEDALRSAEKAREEMKSLHSDNEKLLQEARNERDIIIKEAREIKDKMIGEAKGKANEEAERIIAQAREAIRNEKMAAITELKNQVATLSIEIAEKVLREQLGQDEKQKALMEKMLKDINPN